MPLINYKELFLVVVYSLVLVWFNMFVQLVSFPRKKNLPILAKFIRSHIRAWGVPLASVSFLLSIYIQLLFIFPEIQVFGRLTNLQITAIIILEAILLISAILIAISLRTQELELKSKWLMQCSLQTRRHIMRNTNATQECSICRESHYCGIHIPHSSISDRFNLEDRSYTMQFRSILVKNFLLGVLGCIMLLIAFSGIVLPVLL